ncbi:MAG: hypothetical protein JSR39_08810 [Verrucomicrobia bacterium]|nr:hypothetical protein [Verrucomicrobiota bacterium]
MSTSSGIRDVPRQVIIQRVPAESIVSPSEFLQKVKLLQFDQASKMLEGNPGLKNSLDALKLCDRVLEEKLTQYCASGATLDVIWEDDEDAPVLNIQPCDNKEQILREIVEVAVFLGSSDLVSNYSQLCLAGALLLLDERARLMECMQTMTRHQNPRMQSPLMDLNVMEGSDNRSLSYRLFFKPLADEIKRFLKSEDAPVIPYSIHFQHV